MTTEDDTDEARQAAPTPAPVLSEAETEWRLEERRALALSKSQNAIPKNYQGRPADILAAWAMAHELGLSPMAALRGIFVVNGKPQLSGDLLLSIAKANGVRVVEVFDGDGEEFHASCTAIMRDGEEITRTFSVEDAKQAQLWESGDAWKKYGKRMLLMRARGFCLRDAIPHLLSGCYGPGEIIDVTPHEIEP